MFAEPPTGTEDRLRNIYIFAVTDTILIVPGKEAQRLTGCILTLVESVWAMRPLPAYFRFLETSRRIRLELAHSTLIGEQGIYENLPCVTV